MGTSSRSSSKARTIRTVPVTNASHHHHHHQWECDDGVIMTAALGWFAHLASPAIVRGPQRLKGGTSTRCAASPFGGDASSKTKKSAASPFGGTAASPFGGGGGGAGAANPFAAAPAGER